MKRYLPFALAFLLLAGCNSEEENPGGTDKKPVDTPVVKDNGVPAPQRLKAIPQASFPHDTGPFAFTEGLQVYNGKLYEGTGDYANSALRIAELKTGKILEEHKMGSASIFGEGINVFKGKIYQLTWQNHIVYIYDVKNIKSTIKTEPWGYEGWGMTNDGTHLIISDGKADGHLYYVNPDSGFNKIAKVLTVQDNSGPVFQLNELEYIEGFIYANVWNTDNIVKIDPRTGNVVAVIDCSGLLGMAETTAPGFKKEENVLNGIAYDAAAKKIYITGKRWPKLFEVKFQ